MLRTLLTALVIVLCATMGGTSRADVRIETMDMRAAQRSYEANLNVITAARRMLQRTIDILRV